MFIQKSQENESSRQKATSFSYTLNMMVVHGPLRLQGIRRHGIDLVVLVHHGISITRINICKQEACHIDFTKVNTFVIDFYFFVWH